jgi:hypothetical protein
MSTPQEQATKATTTALATVTAELAELEHFKIESDDDNEFAADMLRDVKARHKRLEAERLKIAGPLTQASKAVNDLFRKPKALLASAEHLLKGKIAGYLEACEAANAEALEAAATADTPEQATEALATVATAAAPAGVNVRYRYQAIVFNADIVPDAFRMPDEDKIQAYTDEAVRTKGTPEPIPGVKFAKTPIVSSRAVKS